MRARTDFSVHLDPDALALQQLGAGRAADRPAGDGAKGAAARKYGGRDAGRPVRTAAASGRRRYEFRRS
jgi:hypothetical protein